MQTMFNGPYRLRLEKRAHSSESSKSPVDENPET